MIQDIPWTLLEKHFAYETSGVENKQVQAWIDKAPENSIIFDQLLTHFKQTGSLPVEFVPDSVFALDNISRKLKSNRRKIFKLQRAWYGAAASILIIAGCLWLFSKTSQTQSQSQALLSHCTTDTTTFSIVLSDGTKVWLNNGSKLEYPEKFGALREVHLLGEGYFEVAHDQARPFHVKTAENTIRDLGTKFDIRSYKGETKTSVSVTEGKVSFDNRQGNQIILSMGQKSSYSLSNRTFDEISTLDPNCLAWKTKAFFFDNKPLGEVFQMLSEVYHFSYTFNNKALENRRITTQFKELSLKDIISVIAMATNADITIYTTPKTEVIIK